MAVRHTRVVKEVGDLAARYLRERDDARLELAKLRLSVRRIAEMTDPQLVIPDESAERGWNRLCGEIIDSIVANS